MLSLLKSKAFWTAVLALLQTILLNYLGVPQDIWMAINAILITVIAAFTIDEASAKLGMAVRDAMNAYLTKINKK